jgi:hypothetical protein
MNSAIDNHRDGQMISGQPIPPAMRKHRAICGTDPFTDGQLVSEPAQRRFMTRLAMVIMASALLVSCGQTEEAQQEHIDVKAALRQFVAGIQVSLLDRGTTNTNDFMILVESYSSSTNAPAEELRKVCDVVWVNSNFNDWLTSVSPNSHSTATAIITKYKTGDPNVLVGIDFNGTPIQPDAIPNSGFQKIDLTEMQAPAQ